MFSALRKLIRRASYWLHRDRHERDLREEMEEHRRMRGAASVASPALHAENSRAVWIPAGIGSLVQDLRYGARQLRHSRMFTFVSLSGLALAIGLNTAAFSVVDAISWRPLPVRDGDRVVRLLRVDRNDRSGSTFSEAELRHYQESGAVESVTGLALDDRISAEWTQGSMPRAVAAFVAPNFFEMLGGRTLEGRLLRPDDEDAALISERAWRQRMQERAGVTGTKISLNGHPFTVVGVVPHEVFAIIDFSADVVLPLRSAPLLRLPELPGMRLIGKLPRGIDLDSGQAALGVAAQRWFAAHPEDTRAYRPIAVPARLMPAGALGGETSLELLMCVAILLVLLIACANLTNLLLARAEARRREMAVRLSLGAGRMRLIRQLLTECFLLTAAAGILGMGTANLALRSAQAALPRYLPPEMAAPWLDLSIDSAAFLHAFTLCLLTAIVFGLVPALEATRSGLSGAMKGDSAGVPAGIGSRLRGLLIAVQIAACVVLLVVTASLNGAMSVLEDFLSSFESKSVVQAQIHPEAYGYKAQAARDFLERLRTRVAGLGEVDSVALTRFPMARALGGGANSELEIEGRDRKLPAPGMHGSISDGMFRVMGLRLESGRDFTAAESRDGGPVVLINGAMARELWPGASPLGQRIRLWTKGKPEPWQEVVGVMEEKTIAGGGAAGHSILRPFGTLTGGILQVRVRGDRGTAARAVGAAVRDMDSRFAANVNSLETMVDLTRWGPRLVSMGSFLIAMASLWMAAIGLYGVTSYIATRRTKEIGIRMALGARPRDVLRMMVRQGSALVAAGVVVGSLLAAVAERVLVSALRLLSARPWETYAAIAMFLAAVALLAMAVPSMRAARADPLTALRHDG